jgi:hypothetical protein
MGTGYAAAFANGTVMTRAALEGELVTGRRWLAGDVATGDVATAGVTANHFPRVETYGFPRHASIGQLTHVHGITYARDQRGDELYGSSSGVSARNLVVTPDLLNAAGGWTWPTGRVRLDVTKNCRLIVQAHWSQRGRDAIGAVPFRLGWVGLFWRSLVNGSAWTELPATRRPVRGQGIAAIPTTDACAAHAVIVPASSAVWGTWDIALRYQTRGDPFTDAASQLIEFGSHNVSVRVYRDY